MAILEVNNLGKSFGTTEVLKDISFSLEKGESLAIIGSSGSGKTTLLRCLNFLETPDQGTIRVGDEIIFDANRTSVVSNAELRKNRLHFGLVFQNFNLFPQYTAFRNVTLAGELLAQERPDFKANKKTILEEIQQRGRDLLASVGLSAKADNYPHQLALNPDILCFDEPTSALDPELTGEVLSVIRSLASEKTTMIIVTHEMGFARQVADNVLFMDKGIVIEYGSPADVIDHPQHERTKRFLENYTNA